ncbi:MAG: TIGR01212 family radical SAM protein [Clostridia bacterium]|nr:TIGR01212 family radical SAM protein [Clostridia bacterium]
MLYYNLSTYFRNKYGKRLKKICIDGGFTCPNRDGRCGTGGCIFCGERGSGEHIDRSGGIDEQVKRVLSQAGEDELFVAYFQNFTNTYAAPEVLRERYSAALIDERIRVLDIGTRPDCIDEEICKVISEFMEKREVWVELGLQTASDKTAAIINRGYKRECFERAMELLEKYRIPAVVHLMVGLPEEGDREIAETCEYLSRFKLFGVKIHSVYVMAGTRLAEMLDSGDYKVQTEEDFIRRAAYIITHIPESTVIHRLTGDCPEGALLAPSWGKDKHKLIDGISRRLAENGARQGSEFLAEP